MHWDLRCDQFSFSPVRIFASTTLRPTHLQDFFRWEMTRSHLSWQRRSIIVSSCTEASELPQKKTKTTAARAWVDSRWSAGSSSN